MYASLSDIVIISLMFSFNILLTMNQQTPPCSSCSLLFCNVIFVDFFGLLYLDPMSFYLYRYVIESYVNPSVSIFFFCNVYSLSAAWFVLGTLSTF